ncbi:DUF1223 domain-containing protein [Pseudooceanicola sp. MF1-13]|uniref:DUF1223 domain-containing protein n=1 Tax=Pseudooceanicola sp. MF1-13 TaxID=3379095 RepID=UPI003892A99D
MFRRTGLAALIMLGFSVGAAPAQDTQDAPVVVELFTSQGCSSCPPADAFLALLAPRDDVIALGIHVDYWDYIGWKDVFGSPAFSARQKAYAKAAKRRAIYTPQMIIDGQADVVGNHPMDVTDQITRFREQPTRVSLTIERAGNDHVSINAHSDEAFTAPLVVQVVRYMPEAHVEITRGENAGHKLTYANIVTDWQIVGEWDVSEPYTAQVKAEGPQPVVVLIQQKGPGRIEAAARLR